MSTSDTHNKVTNYRAPFTISGAPEGLDAKYLAERFEARVKGGDATPMGLHIARDDRRMEAIVSALEFFAPNLSIIQFPAWDCVPYDRVSPSAVIVARRMSALARLIAAKRKGPALLITTVNGIIQRVPTRQSIKSKIKQIAPGQRIDIKRFSAYLERMGYARASTVMEPGEYASRGGIVDLFPPGRAAPVRLDFFGDTLESMRSFDPETQRTMRKIGRLVLLPVSEVNIDKKTRVNFRQRYVETFGAVTSEDPLYEAISAGIRYQGMEHWLPLFHDELERVFDYLPENTEITLDHDVSAAFEARFEQISEHYTSRDRALEKEAFGAATYHPVAPDTLYLNELDLARALSDYPTYQMTPFNVAPQEDRSDIIALGGKTGRNFTAERHGETLNVFDAVVEYIHLAQSGGKRILIAAWSNGARERVMKLLTDHGLSKSQTVESWQELQDLPKSAIGFTILGLEEGLTAPDLTIISEQDVLGDRLNRPRTKVRKASEVLTEAATLATGDFVVHAEHGIGKFVGLKTLEVLKARHDCLELEYHGGDRLYLPVENIELLSRYGADSTTAPLDRLGGSAWQARKSKLKKRIRDMAEKLIAVAAARALKTAPIIERPDGIYDEFCARFPHEETDDQIASINAVLEDLSLGRPMDRLVCGDVGFGKTEVALRAAFAATMGGKQVALVVPTTLLARQHFKTFEERLADYPLKVAHASRLVDAKTLTQVKEGLKTGEVDIVIGTHALLGKSVEFRDLGLLIIDEEQHFGVQHKERLKQMRGDVHVLTLTATPIPRTLQLSLAGVRELSLITTPPVDRLAVRTYVAPVDALILREALMRERFRGGQSFYVVPRIKDIAEITEFLAEHVPELKVATAHGQLAPGRLDEIMTAFYDRQYDVLLSTTIIESGIDIPSANTLIVHKAHMFGLSQLYQLRGRVGRSKTRAYAYFTIPMQHKLTEAAERRLKVLQSLDTLGAGFSLASHDLDIRGGGNLLGEEQSGHIREVGFELYQSLLEEAIAALKEGGEAELEDKWSPQISLGTSALIPDSYIKDLPIRLGLYRRLSTLDGREEIDAFAAELIDRFGAYPEEVTHLLEIVEIKGLCRRANISNVDAGPMGAVITFRENTFANPDALLKLSRDEPDEVRIEPKDQKVIFKAEWKDAEAKLKGVHDFVQHLVELAVAAS